MSMPSSPSVPSTTGSSMRFSPKVRVAVRFMSFAWKGPLWVMIPAQLPYSEPFAASFVARDVGLALRSSRRSIACEALTSNVSLHPPKIACEMIGVYGRVHDGRRSQEKPAIPMCQTPIRPFFSQIVRIQSFQYDIPAQSVRCKLRAKAQEWGGNCACCWNRGHTRRS